MHNWEHKMHETGGLPAYPTDLWATDLGAECQQLKHRKPFQQRWIWHCHHSRMANSSSSTYGHSPENIQDHRWFTFRTHTHTRGFSDITEMTRFPDALVHTWHSVLDDGIGPSTGSSNHILTLKKSSSLADLTISFAGFDQEYLLRNTLEVCFTSKHRTTHHWTHCGKREWVHTEKCQLEHCCNLRSFVWDGSGIVQYWKGNIYIYIFQYTYVYIYIFIYSFSNTYEYISTGSLNSWTINRTHLVHALGWGFAFWWFFLGGFQILAIFLLEIK